MLQNSIHSIKNLPSSLLAKAHNLPLNTPLHAEVEEGCINFYINIMCGAEKVHCSILPKDIPYKYHARYRDYVLYQQGIRFNLPTTDIEFKPVVGMTDESRGIGNYVVTVFYMLTNPKSSIRHNIGMSKVEDIRTLCDLLEFHEQNVVEPSVQQMAVG